jgi:hypothetical protein
MLRSNTDHERFDFKVQLSRKEPSNRDKERAHEILIKCCGPTDNIPKRKAKECVKDAKEKIIEDIFEKDQKLINLPLLLDGSVPSGLLYLLNFLDGKLEAISRHEVKTSVNALYTHV